MPFKATNSSKITVSSPAKGTIKSISKFTGAAQGNISKQSTATALSLEKQENANPTEIISLVDFNRVYERRGESGVNFTPYGQYFRALQSVHSITTEDVTYVVSKALENDTTGAWKTLKDGVDSSIIDARDFVQDLSELLNKIEQAERSLDIARSGDQDMRSYSVEYLTSKVKKYHQNPETRTFNPEDFYTDASSLTGSKILKLMISEIRDRITLESDENNQLILTALAAPNDLNSKNPGDFWSKMQKPISKSAKLATCARLLSQVLMLSSGIPKISNDSISGRVSFDPKNLDAIFNGTSANARPGKTGEPDKVPFVRRLSREIGPNFLTLSMLQKNSSDGKVVVPVEVEDDPRGRYYSGMSKMIRESIKNGDYQFTDFSEFVEQFETSRRDVEIYSEFLVGQCDATNLLTPDEILRTVIKYFTKAIEVCEYSKMAGYELLAVKKSNVNLDMKQAVLRAAGRTKYFQLTANVNSGTSGEESSYDTSVTTTKTSSGESITDSATVTTTQSQNKSPNRPVRVIERNASDSPTSTEIRDYIYSNLLREAKDGPPTKQELQKKIDKLKVKLEEYKLNRNISIAALAAAVAGGAATGFFTLGVGIAAGASAAAAASASIAYFEGKIRETEATIDKTEERIKNAPSYDNKDTVKQQLYDMTLTTNGTVISCLVDAYNELVSAAVARLPSGQKLTDAAGTTRFGNLDEFGMLALLVQMFGSLADQIEISVSKDSGGNLLLDGNDGSYLRSFKLDLRNLTPDNEEYGFDFGPCDDAVDTRSAMNAVVAETLEYQNVQAFLSAYSSVLLKSRDDLILGVNDILGSPGRRATFDNQKGRKLMSELTTQQIIYRRALLDRYLPTADFGYLPERTRFSQPESVALATLLSSDAYAKRESENTRIAFVGIPIGTLNESVKYKNEDLGNVNFSGFVELLLYKKDQQFDDLVFKPSSYLFDPKLFVVASSFDSIQTKRISPNDDVALRIAKLCKYRLYDRDDQRDLTYEELKSHERYSKLSSKVLQDITKNTVVSYLLETYVFKITGMIFDESISLDLNDSVSQAATAALGALSSLNLPDLKLPTATQINSLIVNGSVDFTVNVDGVSTGDRELVAAMAESYLMKQETPLDRLVATPKFDRVVAISFDPDRFEVDVEKTKSESGEAGLAMLRSMAQSNMLVENNGTTRVIPRDPVAGGFSVGSFSCQFVPHTFNSDGSSLIQTFESKLIKNGAKAAKVNGSVKKIGNSKIKNTLSPSLNNPMSVK
jgi:hypothetical protein